MCALLSFQVIWKEQVVLVVEAAPTTNTTCSFQITGKDNKAHTLATQVFILVNLAIPGRYKLLQTVTPEKSIFLQRWLMPESGQRKVILLTIQC